MKRLVTESDILNIIRAGTTELRVSEKDIITALAMDKIREARIKLVQCSEQNIANDNKGLIRRRRAIVGCDHTGLKTKAVVTRFLADNGIEFNDAGTYSEIPVDISVVAGEVAKKIKEGRADFAILIDPTGSASAMIANKTEGIRAAVCYCSFSAKSAREQLNANIITLGSETLGTETVKTILHTFINIR